MKNFYFILSFFSFSLFVVAQTGSSTEVGVTNGELSVSLSGAANYKIPIGLPQGINNIAPQLSLAYNSQAGIGLVGYGWNVMGISAITRIPSTIYHDGTISTVDFSESDRLALDDKRLILKSSEKFDLAATKRIYETEVFSNLKITYYKGFTQNNSQDIAMSPVDYFIVEYPDGSSAKYENHGSATDWTISYWENPLGAFISYEYYAQYSGSTSPSNNAVIEKIKYGSLKSSLTQINEVQFVYKPRYRAEQAYVGGKSFIRDKMLSAINIKSNNVGFKSYSLTHDSSSLGYERLTSITEKSGDGTKSYNPTVFEYEANQSLLYPKIEWSGLTNSFSMSASSNNFINGDFDGDGDLEFLNQNSNGKLSLNKILNNSTVVNLAEINTVFPSNPKIYAVNSLDGNLKILAKQNLCVYATDNPFSSQYFYKIYSYNTDTKNLELDYQKPAPNNRVQPNASLDFDGDGLTDLISLYEPVNGYMDVELVNLDRQKTSDFITKAGSIQTGPWIDTSGGKATSFIGLSSIKYGDVNGDGKMDIIVFRGDPYNDITVYTLKNNVFAQLFRYKQNMPGDIGDMKWSRIEVFPIVMGDFNGDGKCDIFLADLKKILISTGNGFIDESLLSYTPRKYDQTYAPEVLVAYDYNNDGKMDVLSIKPSATGYSNPKSIMDIKLFYRSSSGQWFNYSFNEKLAPSFTRFIPLFTRKNKIDPSKTDLAIIGDGTISFFSNTNYLDGQNLIKSITLGNGVKESITYASLNDANGIYNSGNSQVYPNLNIKFNPGFKIVSQLEKQSTTQYKKQLFRYNGAVMNLHGLGFLGFGSSVKTNWHNDSSPIISYISKNDMSLRGANIENYTVLGLHEPLQESQNQIVSAIEKKDNYTVTATENLVATQSITLNPNTWIKPGSIFSAKINKEVVSNSINEPTSFITKELLTYESNLLLNKVFKIKNISNKHFNGLEDTSSETTTVYDDYNNPVKTTTVNAGSISITDIIYETPSVSPYIIGRPLSKIQNVTVPGDKMTNEELYFYNSNQLLSEIKKKGDATTNYITEKNVYDGFGNIIKKTIIAGPDSRETNYEYDPTGRFLNKSVDVEKLATTFQYNANGTLKSKTNPFSQTALYEYDTWFKKIKETDYLGNKVDYKYTNSGVNTIITKTTSLGGGAEEVYDDLGRKTKAGVKNVMGTFSNVSYLYDIQDRNYKVSEPYIGTAPTQWNEIKYDDYGRTIQNIAASGKVTDIIYSGLTTIVNDGTKSKSTTKNAIGNVVSMTDTPGGTIKYAYFANGNLKESDFAGVKTTILQDGWGRKTELKDSSAGIYKYGYNDFGELTSETAPNGTTTYVLDAVGKVTQKTVVGTYTNSKTTYDYNSFNKLLNARRFEDFSSGANVVTTQFTYDGAQRLSKKVETTPYAVFTKDFKYDSFGRLNTEGSIATRLGKSSVKTFKYNYKNGEHFQILDNATNAVLWQTNTVNARGQLLSAQNGPLTVTNSYDDFGYALQFKNDKTVSTANILTLNTSFDVNKGNLTSRINNLFAWNESFIYDTLDRLTEYNNFQGNKETQYYDDKGKIIQNSLGTYGYSKDKPYQNTSINVTPEALTYYAVKPVQSVSYNTFKSPVQIEEKGIDKISFDYNDSNARTAMFYGDLQDDKLKKPYRKYYAEDGSMEIKENIQTGVLDFVTYIGGDGYSAPVIFKSDALGNEKYLYLQRDYQGSIVSVADQTGTVLEKRLFDAWGGIAKVQDGTGNNLAGLSILDRGYTGHEHLQSVGMINMNGRLYDPKLHRFLQPDNNIQDPFNTQNYNRYGYVLNNPLKYTDPSGEIWEFVLGFFASSYVRGGAASGGEANPFKWNANAWTSAFAGAASSAGSFYASQASTGFANNYLDNYNNKPMLGASAIGPGYNGSSFINNNSYNFLNDPNNVYEDNLAIKGNLSTVGALLGGASGLMNELSIVKFYNAAPAGSFAVNYNGSLRYWSESFKGGTRANISSSVVQAAKNSSNSLKLASKLGGFASSAGSYLGYYGAAENLYNEDYYGATREFSATYYGNYLSKTKGSDVGMAWTIGWNILGPWITNTEPYNNFFFGKNSSIYQARARSNNWYESKIFKD